MYVCLCCMCILCFFQIILIICPPPWFSPFVLWNFRLPTCSYNLHNSLRLSSSMLGILKRCFITLFSSSIIRHPQSIYVYIHLHLCTYCILVVFDTTDIPTRVFVSEDLDQGFPDDAGETPSNTLWLGQIVRRFGHDMHDCRNNSKGRELNFPNPNQRPSWSM